MQRYSQVGRHLDKPHLQDPDSTILHRFILPFITIVCAWALVWLFLAVR